MMGRPASLGAMGIHFFAQTCSVSRGRRRLASMAMACTEIYGNRAS